MKPFRITFLLFTLLFNHLQAYSQGSWVSTSLTSYVVTMKISPNGTIFAAGDGIFRSTDNGKTWITCNNGLPTPTPSILSLCIQNDNTLLIGTFYNGVFRSTNNGITWVKIDSTIGNVTAFAINNSGDIFASSISALFKSTNQGTSWLKIYNNSNGALVIDKNNGTLYASIQLEQGSISIYRSTDNGVSWQPANNGLINGAETITLGINMQGNIFAGTMYHGLFRSVDSGNSWQQINSGLSSNTEWIESFGFQTNGKIFAGSFGHIYLSNDNGGTWGQICKGLPSGFTIKSILSSDNNIFAAWWISGPSSYTFGVSQRTDFASAAFPPIPQNPPNNSKDININPILNWSSLPGSASYYVQVARDSIFSLLIYDQTNNSDTSVHLNGLERGKIYYWRINSNSIEGTSGWSKVFSFTTIYPPLSSPLLKWPNNGAEGVSVYPILKWSAISCTSYSVQIGTDSNFTNIDFNSNNIIDTSVSMTTSLQYSCKYYWHVRAVRLDSISSWSQTWTFFTMNNPNEVVPNISKMPLLFKVFPCYPNPFNPSTNIKFEIPHESFVTLKIFNIIGEEVTSLANNLMSRGYHEITFNAHAFPSGLYLLIFQADNYVYSEKLLLLK